jgi:hypothetical protein
MLGDRVRRAAPDRVGVDPRDGERDEHHPRELLERLQEEPADAGDGAELREVGRHLPVEGAAYERDPDQPEKRDEQRARLAAERQREPHEPEHRRHDEERHDRDALPLAQWIHVRRRLEPGEERREEDQ